MVRKEGLVVMATAGHILVTRFTAYPGHSDKDCVVCVHEEHNQIIWSANNSNKKCLKKDSYALFV